MNQDEKRNYREQLRLGTLVGCGGALSIVGLIFAPLLLALAEYLFFGTNNVEDFLALLGIRDRLDVFYRPIIDFISPYLP